MIPPLYFLATPDLSSHPRIGSSIGERRLGGGLAPSGLMEAGRRRAYVRAPLPAHHLPLAYGCIVPIRTRRRVREPPG